MKQHDAAAGSGPGWSEIAVGLFSFVIFMVGAGLLLGLVPPDQPVAQGIVGSALGGLAAIAAFAVAFSIRIRALAPFGFRRTAVRWLLVGGGLGVIGYGLNVVIQTVYLHTIGNDDPQTILHAAARGGAVPFAALLLAGAVVTPFGEEILFRGVIANALNRYGAWAGIGLSSLIFGLVHGISVILPVAIMVGALSAVLFRRTGSIWPSVVLHCVYNASNGVASALGYSPM